MNIGARNYTQVKVENATDKILIPISSGKPEIPDLIRHSWQNVVNLMARILDVPSVLITHFSESNLDVVAASKSPGNPFHINDKADLGTGLFCETVVGRKTTLAISDTSKSPYWHNNPFASTGMCSYFGTPIEWEDGDLFGTLCILNNKKTAFTTITNDLLDQFKEIIENDLKYIMLHADLANRLTVQEMLIRETHHRINNHFTLLISYIQLQASEGGNNRNIQNILLDIQNRIRSISVIHEELCRTSNHQEHPSLDEYLAKLCDYLIANVTGIAIECHYDVEKLHLPVELSVSIGLVISELMTNSIKYAFTDAKAPAITITIRRTGNNRITIFYKDNGVGFPNDFDIKGSPSLGMNLIKLQIDQLHGELQVNGSNGAEFRIVIDG
jgi:c-di-GMP phosphodiesterase